MYMRTTGSRHLNNAAFSFGFTHLNTIVVVIPYDEGTHFFPLFLICTSPQRAYPAFVLESRARIRTLHACWSHRNLLWRSAGVQYLQAVDHITTLAIILPEHLHLGSLFLQH
jgi:hypothetical protein